MSIFRIVFIFVTELFIIILWLRQGETPLFVAASSGVVSIGWVLFAAGADVNAVSVSQTEFLHGSPFLFDEMYAHLGSVPQEEVRGSPSVSDVMVHTLFMHDP